MYRLSKRPFFILAITFFAPWAVQMHAMGSTQDIIAGQQELLRKKKKNEVKNRYTLNNRVSFTRGENSNFNTLTTTLYYRFSKRFTALFITPFRLESVSGTNRSQGIGDIILEGSYYFYLQQKKKAFYRGTLIGGIKLPTGNHKKVPRLGTGSIDIIGLLSLSRSSRHSYTFASIGGIFPSTNKERKKRGNTLFNTFIFGMISRSACETGLKYMLLMQLDSAIIGRRTEIVIEQNKPFPGEINTIKKKIPDTDARIIYLGPSVYAIKDNITVQWQLQLPIHQKRFNINMRGSCTFTWTF